MADLQLAQSAGALLKPAMRIAGLGRTFTAADIGEIPDLWARLAPNLPLAGQGGGETFGVSRVAPDGSGMHYLAGVALSPGRPIPDGFEGIDLSARSYLVFRQILDGGALHPQMKAAAREIWGKRVPACGLTLAQAPELEVYPPDFQPDQAGAWVEWWLPVEG